MSASNQVKSIEFQKKQDMLEIISLIGKTYNADPEKSQRLVSLLTSEETTQIFRSILEEIGAQTVTDLLIILKKKPARENIKQNYFL